MKLGDLTEKIISVITFGQGKRIASWIANKLGYSSCGCEERKQSLNKIKIKRWQLNLIKMIEKNGKNLEWVKNHSYQEMNFKWYQSCTHPTTTIAFTYLAPVIQNKSNNG